MSNYATYNNILEMKLSNSSEVYFDAEMKRQEMNNTIRELVDQYDLPELIVKGTITFDSNGEADFPTDYFRMVKLWSTTLSGSITEFADAGGGKVTVTSASHGLSDDNDVTIIGTTSYNGKFTVSDVTTNTFAITDTWVADDATGSWTQGTQKNEYQYLVPDLFDQQSATEGWWWTEDYDEVDDSIVIKCLPENSGVLLYRAIQKPTEMIDLTTDCGLSSYWDEAIALGAAYRLYTNAKIFDEATGFKTLFNEKVAEVWNSTKNRGGIKQGLRLKSKFERVSLLGGFTRGTINNKNA